MILWQAKTPHLDCTQESKTTSDDLTFISMTMSIAPYREFPSFFRIAQNLGVVNSFGLLRSKVAFLLPRK